MSISSLTTLTPMAATALQPRVPARPPDLPGGGADLPLAADRLDLTAVNSPPAAGPAGPPPERIEAALGAPTMPAACPPAGAATNAPVVLVMLDEPAVAAPSAPRDGASYAPASFMVATTCAAMAHDGRSLEARTADITRVLEPAVRAASSPDPSWTKATPEQVGLYVQETLAHTDAMQRLGTLRGEDWSGHDVEGAPSKFNPEIAQFLASPDHHAGIAWAIGRHNASPHHSLWKDPSRSAADLRESASDIINAWRMPRLVYQKEPWSWDRIERTIDVDASYGRFTPVQRDALLEAIPYQKALEAQA